jgi:hypothetical protein
MTALMAGVAICAVALNSARAIAGQGFAGTRPQGRWTDQAWDDWQAPAERRADDDKTAQEAVVREPLDFEIRRVAREIAGLQQEPDFVPVANVPSAGAPVGVFPTEFRIMGLLSVLLSIVGVAVVARYRPALRGLRGRNDTSDARRRLLRCVAILAAINLADLAFTAFLAPMPEFIELNPFADLLRGCMPALIVGKLFIIGGCAAAFVVFWRYKIIQLASWCAATTYVGLAIWWVAYFNAARS